MLLRAIELLNEAQGETRWNNQHRLLVELTFLKLMTLDGGNPSAPVSVFATAPIVFPAVTQTPVAVPVTVASPILTPERKPEVKPAPTLPAPPPSAAKQDAPEPEIITFSASPSLPEVKLPEAKQQETSEELPVGFFADDTEDDEDDGIDEDEFGEDTETPSLFGEPEAAPPILTAEAIIVSAVTAAAPLPIPEPAAFEEEPEDSDEDDEAVPFFTDADEPFSDTPFVAPVAVSIAPVYSPALPEALPEPKITEPAPEPEEEDDGIHLDIRQVQQVWNRFLTDAGKISKQTEVMMSKAYPTECEGKKVTITFSERMHFERMNEPSKLQFVRKLLARCLGVESVTIKFVLGEDVQAAPVKVRSGEKKALKRDPLAELLALDTIPEISPAPPDDGFGVNNWATPSPSLPAPPKPKAVYEAPPLAVPTDDFRTARNVAGTNGNSNGSNGSNGSHSDYNGSNGSSNSNGAGYAGGDSVPRSGDAASEARRAIALENPLVQETLQIFGGEIVDE